MIASVFFVSCGESGDVIVNYTDALGKKQVVITTSETTFAELNAKATPGYEFNGWFKDSDHTMAYSLNEKIGDDLTIYAKYTKVKCKVSYYKNDDSDDSLDFFYYFEDDYTIQDGNIFEREGYAFVSWNTKEDGTGDVLDPNDTISLLKGNDVEYYAQWTLIED